MIFISIKLTIFPLFAAFDITTENSHYSDHHPIRIVLFSHGFREHGIYGSGDWLKINK